MSIGSAFQWPQYPTAQAADRLVNKGVVVVASIGNSGANGLYSAGAPGLGQKVIGVASFDNTHVCSGRLRRLAGWPAGRLQPRDWRAAPADLRQPPAGGAPARRPRPTTLAARCRPAASTGKIALIRRGTCGFYQKAYQRTGRGRRRRGALQQRGWRAEPDRRGRPRHHHPRRGDLRRRWRADRQPHRRRADRP